MDAHETLKHTLGVEIVADMLKKDACYGSNNESNSSQSICYSVRLKEIIDLGRAESHSKIAYAI